MIGIIALELKEGQILVRTQHLDADTAATLVSLAIKTLEEVEARSGSDTLLKVKSDSEETFDYPRGIFIGYNDENQSLMVDVNDMKASEALEVLCDLDGSAELEPTSA